MAKGLKLKVRKFWGLIPTFGEITEENLLGGPFWPSWIGLNLEQHILAGGQRKPLNRGRMLNLIIKKGKDQKKFHTVVAPHVVVLTPIHFEKLMEMT